MPFHLCQFSRWLLICLLCLVNAPLHAALDIEIFGGGTARIPIAILPFSEEGRLPQSVTSVISADLQRSGLFRLVDPAGRALYEPKEIDYVDWTNRGASALVIGQTVLLPNGQAEISFRLMDVAKQVQLTRLATTVPVTQLRAAAHRIADIIYEALTGDVGVFSTRIAYVLKQGNKYALQVADADGFNAQSVIEFVEPIISPVWSPDGGELAYVSFENKKPVVYIQTLATGTRRVVASFKGSNSAPAWSPDGKKLAVVLTMQGSSQIFLINVDGSGVQRLSRSSGIDTEPGFSPDGRSIIFTSDRGGSPQIYRMAIAGTASGVAERLTYEGNYNVSPDFSRDGKYFTFIHRNNNRFNVAIQDIATGQMQLLTNSQVDESPSFAPNNKMILYATEIRGRGILSAVTSDGQTRQQLSSQEGDIREPAWGPLQGVR
ncbi:MAG: Tol-Pal system beta propeller repeat protein TolB [Nitrosomonas sp.]|nr:Tol-Pal system beta propeller repeat protein TolB [Nitrosomonas sp.]MDP1951246.1 Tol-Pal system beta propeller repeat protein TolB [Nitrosomonas sp.]